MPKSNRHDRSRHVVALRPMDGEANDLRRRSRGAARRPIPGRRDALRQVGSIVLFAVLPRSRSPRCWRWDSPTTRSRADFHHELYPQAKEMLDGRNPYPARVGTRSSAPTSSGRRSSASCCAADPLPLGAADVVMLAARPRRPRALALARGRPRLARLRRLRALAPGRRRDARLPPDTGPVPALAARLAHRDPAAPGAAVGLATALKFLSGRSVSGSRRPAARAASSRRCRRRVSLLLVLPFTARPLRPVAPPSRAGIDQDSYTRVRAAGAGGAPESAARARRWVVRRASSSRPGATGASRWRSPQPLRSPRSSGSTTSRSRPSRSPSIGPRLSWVWFPPLATWGLEGAGLGIGTSGTRSARSCLRGRARGCPRGRAGGGGREPEPPGRALPR